ncbi:uncharacterized protein LOC111715406 [Eurytemora carolleeae]|uniref:uncharacterized protein LOC111715406 n=1 Tax=Eurytemora carolleeae TaxID=1294199 RepID=UPI000C75970A|nr:uncharacterized protein LOC111715406 [Eurytemora carolleeae]XP_023346486.1 uncharacterized protein LOC111715406 [Eurytemora carolleeae]|eukprot:XP_023346485.1 uncharacterized protein LOC111715406 [Eurytemora affinis]
MEVSAEKEENEDEDKNESKRKKENIDMGIQAGAPSLKMVRFHRESGESLSSPSRSSRRKYSHSSQKYQSLLSALPPSNIDSENSSTESLVVGWVVGFILLVCILLIILTLNLSPVSVESPGINIL